MSIQLLAIDLDGTLLDKQSKVSQANVEALSRAVEAGLHVVISTGRSWQGGKGSLEAPPFEGPRRIYYRQ